MRTISRSVTRRCSLGVVIALAGCTTADTLDVSDQNERLTVGDDEVAYKTGPCVSHLILTTPLAKQCCYTLDVKGNYTLFLSARTNTVVKRNRNIPGAGAACKASDGTSSCNGSGCFY